MPDLNVNLASEQRALLTNAVRGATQRDHERAVNAWTAFCAQANIDALGATEQQLSLFAAYWEGERSAQPGIERTTGDEVRRYRCGTGNGYRYSAVTAGVTAFGACEEPRTPSQLCGPSL